MRTVVGRVKDDGVFGNAEFIKHLQEFSYVHIVLDHAVTILILTGDATQFFLYMGPEMHSGPIPPAEERLTRLGSALNKVNNSL
jgi:hypothetical protein